ncbi:hypothetical protein [Caulobacter sp. 1776]|uniref:hypothetical protein n=1 Tax=Caulobacter sp. 1776 TaxID=3156420 RepID=UPI00339B4854
MGFLTEMLAVAVVWLSSFALCQFGVAVDHNSCPHAKSVRAKTVARSPAAKPAPIAANAPASPPRDA